MGVDVHLANLQTYNILMWEVVSFHSQRTDWSESEIYIDFQVPEANREQTKGDMSLK